MFMLKYYERIHQSENEVDVTREKLQNVTKKFKYSIAGLQKERCYYIAAESNQVAEFPIMEKMLWIFTSPFGPGISTSSYLEHDQLKCSQLMVEIGPRLNFCSPFSTNAVSICKSLGFYCVTRIETSTRYLISLKSEGRDDLCGPPTAQGDGPVGFSKPVEEAMVGALHDPMTECRYVKPLTDFGVELKADAVFDVDILNRGSAALEEVNEQLGLGFDDWDFTYYTQLFREKIVRNPTNVECFDLAQSNSEHSRHWFFKGQMSIDGVMQDNSLLDMVIATQDHSNSNNVIKFCDNSSGIEGYNISSLCMQSASKPSPLLAHDSLRHIIFTAETHNFPTGVAPFPGATTGTGGRIRDVQAAGRGGHVIAGTAGYSVGSLCIPGYDQPWEDASFKYPKNFAKPLDILIEASNGASDYGNKFGEPVLTGFARSFGALLPSGERREWVKPIMFSGGIGSVDAHHVSKQEPEKGMLIVKVGGPVYRLGVGGGAASSVQIQGDNTAERDYNAVQRGDAQMEQKMNRVIRACLEMRDANPICSIHDQGAGGNGNVLKELCAPAGGTVYSSQFQLGDPSISLMELWGAEYQESNALLAHEDHRQLLESIACRECCPLQVVGNITDNGRMCLVDDRGQSCPSSDAGTDLGTTGLQRNGEQSNGASAKNNKSRLPVDLDLELVLGKMPQKEYTVKRLPCLLTPLDLPCGITVEAVLQRVLRLPSVASKRFLTNKVDRSVTGLIAQQQCVGPLHTPLADVAVIALSHFDTVGFAFKEIVLLVEKRVTMTMGLFEVGGATAIGEQPIKMLVDAASGARMTVAESLTNLVFAKISSLKDVKLSGNWMWPAKLPGEGALLYDACVAACKLMGELGVAVDGGKDSLSMAARLHGNVIKAPGNLVLSSYAPCPDITATVTPDFKCPQGKGCVLYVPLALGQHRLGGTALAQCYQQIGQDCPDVEDAQMFVQAFAVIQTLIGEHLLSAGHDVSDGGLITCVLEMAFSGNCGLDINFSTDDEVSSVELLFAEEVGFVLEVGETALNEVTQTFRDAGVTCLQVGHTSAESRQVCVRVNGETVVKDSVGSLRAVWEETSCHLDALQANPHCVQQEKHSLLTRQGPNYCLTFQSQPPQMKIPIGITGVQPRVAIVREEGSNGDREMAAAFHLAGFEVWDVNMHDLCTEQISLDRFQGLAFVGGFSYGDVCGSAKGWAATIKFNEKVQAEFSRFYHRANTFSIGVCNGCQLMALLGWVGEEITGSDVNQGVHLASNQSGRFESRFVTVKISPSPAMMLQGMQGSKLGVWVAHAEGRIMYKTPAVESRLEAQNLQPIVYVDDDGTATTDYPLNPNGSPGGIAAMCSTNGRHLAMMPHPERCVLPWQWPWMPNDWRNSMQTSPWLQMFTNAHKWCEEMI